MTCSPVNLRDAVVNEWLRDNASIKWVAAEAAEHMSPSSEQALLLGATNKVEYGLFVE